MTASWEWETQHDCLGQEGLPLRSPSCVVGLQSYSGLQLLCPAL